MSRAQPFHPLNKCATKLVDMAYYPLAPTALGSGREYALQLCNHYVAWRTYRRHGARVTVSIKKLSDGWHVVGPEGFLGVLDDEVQQKYSDLQRVWDSGHIPQTTVWLSPNWDAYMRIRIQLANPAFAVPVGRISSQAEVLEQGVAHQLELQKPFEHTTQVLVDLVDAGNHVAALYNDHLLGAISHPDPALLHEVKNRTLAARAFLADGHGALDISPYLTSAPIPALTAEEPDLIQPPELEAASKVITLHTSAIELIDPSKKI